YAISKVTQKTQDDVFVNRLIDLANSSPDFVKKLDKKDSFAVPIIDNGLGYIVTFLNIKNIDKKDAGYVVSFGKLQDIVELEKRYNIFILIGFLVALFVFILVVIVIIQVQKIKEESLKLHKFIDIQNSIVILTDGVEFKFANKKFFDFFGYKDLDDFLKEHSCICDKFIHNSNFFSLSDVRDNWVESLLMLSGRKRIVSMIDKTLVTHTFTVSINKYDENYYIIDFGDISDTMREKFQLQEQVVQDQLTKAYNRVYFDNNIEAY
ncbi:MAG: GGDEF domain-containing protein, partial [Campylobacterota bacterium]|nr:GGDEF domain-containing protein [Campylobacterota bacterium]